MKRTFLPGSRPGPSVHPESGEFKPRFRRDEEKQLPRKIRNRKYCIKKISVARRDGSAVFSHRAQNGLAGDVDFTDWAVIFTARKLWRCPEPHLSLWTLPFVFVFLRDLIGSGKYAFLKNSVLRQAFFDRLSCRVVPTRGRNPPGCSGGRGEKFHDNRLTDLGVCGLGKLSSVVCERERERVRVLMQR
jgi:hypothetical protein